MATQILLTIPDELFDQARRLAKVKKQDVSDLLVDSIVLEKSTSEDDPVERERQAYLSLHEQLKEKYPGEYVAIYQGKLVDHDADGVALSSRINKKYPHDFVLMRKVEPEPERILYFRSPRFMEEG